MIHNGWFACFCCLKIDSETPSCYELFKIRIEIKRIDKEKNNTSGKRKIDRTKNTGS